MFRRQNRALRNSMSPQWNVMPRRNSNAQFHPRRTFGNAVSPLAMTCLKPESNCFGNCKGRRHAAITAFGSPRCRRRIGSSDDFYPSKIQNVYPRTCGGDQQRILVQRRPAFTRQVVQQAKDDTAPPSGDRYPSPRRKARDQGRQ